ncbi:arginine deiminase [Labilibaculum sp. A4]|uniref:arginine deiminase n=1 Tax=Labilibaculum euxinus TaxID=2686357 RepID=A0A425YAN4_9BACT|nr:arginine deiminase family protein [Labilibaculum euxinus]MDQ1773049.1 arginine deiminase family protein [Labilibaculum euxinus]MUP39261.1 arginine deiminase [Labilibaculum euxinus]MVB08466.1 arginine deiminase [Labilibaculum euxinus]MWN77189.1 arginine deiminase [Labilibaculum euxinus]
MTKYVELNVRSEIGELEGVILHTPGSEVENMTPENAERALYSDILNLSVAKDEYKQLSGVLSEISETYQVKDLLADVLADEKAKENVIDQISAMEPQISVKGNTYCIKDFLLEQTPPDLASLLIEGVPLKRDNLTKFLSKERYAMRPLHNFFFTRDASMSVLDEVLIGKMASSVRDRESLIMQAIFDYTPGFKTKTVNPIDNPEMDPNCTIEGGDVLIAREDIMIIGNGTRTSTQGIDFILAQLLCQKDKTQRHLLIQELPSHPESFIHLDMVFTLLDVDKCMVYEPLIIRPNKYQTVHIAIENGKVISITRENNLLQALKKLGMDLKPIYCGGNGDPWNQEREQWHSGANFFAVGPGKVIGYGRNVHTMDAMNKNGFEILRAKDIIRHKVELSDYEKYVITLEGSELPRGGGGARCMTMPVRRKPVNW